MKTKLKQNGGFAIVYVIFFLMVLSLMGTAMYLYSVTSLRSVRFLSDRKKAEYLAQAGVESAAYAYQMTFSSTDKDDPRTKLRANTTDDGHVIESNEVYMLYKDGKYQFGDAETANTYKDRVIGKYKVSITTKAVSEAFELLQEVEGSIGNNGADFRAYESEIHETQREFEATGYVLDSSLSTVKASATKKAYMAEPVQGKGKYYGEDGIINAGYGTGTTTVYYTDSSGARKPETVKELANTNFDLIGKYTTPATLTYRIQLFNNIPLIGKYIGVDMTIPINLNSETERTNPIVMGYTSGNMILDAPETGVVSLKSGQNNFVSFVGKNNLFINTDIDVTPSKKHFNVMFLRGNNIVINGDIEIYVYGYTRSTFSLFQNVTTLATALAGNYCWSTVVIGTSDQDTVDAEDPYVNSVYKRKVTSLNSGTVSTSYTNGLGRCGKVFFGGNVFVNIQVPNVGIYRYRAFSAGDTYYYDDNLPQAEGGREGYGIDLLKYFFDYSMATRKYSENVLTRFGEVMGMYYSSIGTNQTPTTYVLGADEDGTGTENIAYNSMRKIDRKEFAGYDSLSSLVPPSQNDASALVWLEG